MTKFVNLGELSSAADMENAICEMARVLSMGGVVLHPTETCYGLAASALNGEAVKKIYKIKGRSFHNPVNICVYDEVMATLYGDFPVKLLDLTRSYWPGPLTVLVERADCLPEFLNPGEQRVGIRVPGDDFFREVIGRVGAPIVSTSANVAGENEIYMADLDVFPLHVRDLVDLVVDRGVIPFKKPSTIVGVDESGHLTVLREGEIDMSKDQRH
ncbi:threonylcarbamoyl-AMP synthase [Candidatus Peregrinibacteria bacterium HGW-Peregrinibacteria-1]|jgi:L-threonylcarbamoyladenylate synthase|nr:MAG: threonylcarbamoyl-AMP synthase [Candidatus Peregrinibacteria bacterium HGW-Peregrinibacteria-1]